MMAPVLAPSLWQRIFSFRDAGRPPARCCPPVRSDAENLAARRDFIAETILGNPNAFSSEQDICHMMSCFPERL